MAPIESPDYNEDSEEEGDNGRPPKAVEKERLSPREAREKAKTAWQCKEAGLGAYKIGNFKKAIECWTTTVTNLQELKEDGLSCFDEQPEEEVTIPKVLEMELTVNLNLGQAHLKDGNFHKALGYCESVLAREPHNVKALYRKASALLQASRYAEARISVGLLLEADAENSEAKLLLNTIARQEQASRKTAKKSAAKMFTGMAPDPRSERPEPIEEKDFAWWEKVFCCRRRPIDEDEDFQKRLAALKTSDEQ